MAVIAATDLTNFEVAPDGSTISINVADQDGRPGSLVLPADCLRALIMTLPEMMRLALQRRFGDPSLRLVYPVERWRVEASAEPEKVILTISAGNGFQVSFGLSPDELGQIAHSGSTGVTQTVQLAARTLLN